MDRRAFLQKSIAASLAVAVEPLAQAKTAAGRPNVLYIFSDQHRAVSLPGEPFNQAVAPNLDAFRQSNFCMDACISNYPVCSPYRSMLISGRWPCETGVINLETALSTNEITLGDTFQKNGYHTGYVGKWHLSGLSERGPFIPKGRGRMGFEDWHIWYDTNNHYNSWTYDPDTGVKIQPKGYNLTLMTDQAVEFLYNQKKDKPWLLVLSWNPPHPPFNPPAEELDRYKPEDLQLRPNVKLLPDATGPLLNELVSRESLRIAERSYYGSITAVDKEFARVLKTLEDSGQAENTIVVYTSDHGEMMGSHGFTGKELPHEESCRVPFFVRYPGVTPKGGKSDVLFASIDIYPTLCGLAGIPVPPHCRGRDLSAVMRGKKIQSPETVLLMNERAAVGMPDHYMPSWRGARTQTHTYGVDEDGRWCLYDNVADPYQMTNLVRDPKYIPLMAKLDAVILDWMKSTNDPFPFRDAVTKFSLNPA